MSQDSKSDSDRKRHSTYCSGFCMCVHGSGQQNEDMFLDPRWRESLVVE